MDLSLHAARPSAETLLITNQLLMSTANQLNVFAARCEEKLATMHHKMLRLETGVKLLESKLNSLPGGGADAQASVAVPAAPPPPGAAEPSAAPDTAAASDSAAAVPAAPALPATPATPVTPAPAAEPVAEPPAEPAEPLRKIKDDPRFAKYFKMVNFGVPKPVVILKFKQETGADPALLDTPDAPAPPGGEEESDDDSAGSD